MKTLVQRFSLRRAVVAAVSIATLNITHAVNAQNGPSDAPEVQGPSGILAAKGADPSFDQYVNLERLVEAWSEMNSQLFTDAALQVADGERVLLRPHRMFKTTDLLDLAIRMASENQDKESLTRLSTALERSGDKQRLAAVNLALKASGTSRAVDVSFSQGEADSRLTAETIRSDIQAARVSSSRGYLEAIEKSLADFKLSDAQRNALRTEVVSSKEAVSDNSSLSYTAEQLNFLAGIERPIDGVKEPQGQKFTLPPSTGQRAERMDESQADQALILEFIKAQNSSGSSEARVKDPFAALKGSSRAGEVISRYSGVYGRTSIWQWVNQDGLYKDTNCGTAAFATIMTYWKSNLYPTYGYGSNSTVRRIEKAGLGPDVPSFGAQWPFANFGGGGTSKNRMQSIADWARFNYYWSFGEASLKDHVKKGWPVVVLLDIANDKAGSPSTYNKTFGFHWVVVFAYDANNYYATNWPGTAIPAAKFRAGYQGWLHQILGINQGFMMAWPK